MTTLLMGVGQLVFGSLISLRVAAHHAGAGVMSRETLGASAGLCMLVVLGSVAGIIFGVATLFTNNQKNKAALIGIGVNFLALVVSCAGVAGTMSKG